MYQGTILRTLAAAVIVVVLATDFFANRAALAASSGMRVPDFTNCGFTTSEPELDWRAAIHGATAPRGSSSGAKSASPRPRRS